MAVQLRLRSFSGALSGSSRSVRASVSGPPDYLSNHRGCACWSHERIIIVLWEMDVLVTGTYSWCGHALGDGCAEHERIHPAGMDTLDVLVTGT